MTQRKSLALLKLLIWLSLNSLKLEIKNGKLLLTIGLIGIAGYFLYLSPTVKYIQITNALSVGESEELEKSKIISHGVQVGDNIYFLTKLTRVEAKKIFDSFKDVDKQSLQQK